MAQEYHSVFLWSIDEFLIDSEQMMNTLGYKRHARLIWDKTNGIAPAFSIRFCHEYLTWFYKGVFQPVSAQTKGKFRTVITEKAREHSRKPDLAYYMINKWYPFAKCLDVFSREKRLGWDQWGNEINRYNNE